MNVVQKTVFDKFQQSIPGSPHIAQKFGASIAEKGLNRKAGNLTVKPQQAKTVTAKVAEGNPLVNLNLDPGMGLAATFTIVMDMSQVGGGSGNNRTKVILFDVHKWHQNRNGISNPFPNGQVYVEDPIYNVYDCIVNGICSDNLHLFGFTIRATKVDTATVNEKQQVNQNLIHHTHNADGFDRRTLRVNQYYDAYQYDNTKQTIGTKGRFSRVDKGTALEYWVYNGMIVEMDLFIAATTKD